MLRVQVLCVLLVWTSVCARAAAAGQFDDFNSGQDADWTHYEPLAGFGAGGSYSFPNEGYRIVAAISPAPAALGPARAGSLRVD